MNRTKRSPAIDSGMFLFFFASLLLLPPSLSLSVSPSRSSVSSWPTRRINKRNRKKRSKKKEKEGIQNCFEQRYIVTLNQFHLLPYTFFLSLSLSLFKQNKKHTKKKIEKNILYQSQIPHNPQSNVLLCFCALVPRSLIGPLSNNDDFYPPRSHPILDPWSTILYLSVPLCLSIRNRFHIHTHT